MSVEDIRDEGYISNFFPTPLPLMVTQEGQSQAWVGESWGGGM